MKKLLLLLFFVSILSLDTAQAQQISVDVLQFGTAVENREVVGADTVFSSNIEKIFCLSHVTGAQAETEIVHAWYYEDEEKARVELSVRSNDWRTWSSKNILPSWTGNWRVVIEDLDGNELASKSFTIRNN